MKRTISVQSGVYRCALLLSTLLLPLAGMALEPEQRQAAQSQLSLLTRALDFEAQRASSSNKDLGRNGDAHSILPGESLTLLDAAGPGIVNHFWNTVGTADPFYARSLVLRIYYDGQESPSVEAPLGDFSVWGMVPQKNWTPFLCLSRLLGVPGCVTGRCLSENTSVLL